MRGRSIVLYILISFFFSQYLMYAQTTVNPDSALYSILNEHKGTRLSLDQAKQYAVDKSTAVKIAEGTYEAAKGAVRRDAGFFDPAFFFNFNYIDSEAPTASFFSGAPVLMTKETDYATGLRMNLPIGTQIELAINAAKLETNSAFASLNPEYNTFGSLSLRQPLLGGFMSSGREQLNISENLMAAQKSRFDQQSLAIYSEVEQAYWDLYAAERNFAVQQLIRNQAAQLMKETELRASSGLVGPNQVANARTFLAEQESMLLEREEQLDSQSDRLAALIGVRPASGDYRFIPADEPQKDFSVDDAEALVELALKNNLELQASQNDIEAGRSQLNAAKWRALPQVDLVGSIGGNGLAGTGQEIEFGGQVFPAAKSGSFNDALSQVFKRDYPNWSVGVDVSIPIGLRSGLGEKDRVKAEVYIAEQRYTAQERAVEEQVRMYWREVSHGKRRLDAAAEGVNAAQEQVRIGLIEFQNGRTTAFELSRLGSDLAVAQQRYSEALVRTAKAAAALQQLTSGKYTGRN